ncbi:MAG: hypothetical protein J0L84_08610 [Verrucomicrobia bacterium]|nr:hypothetical protein [Verrucomicrobiota bacterium]
MNTIRLPALLHLAFATALAVLTGCSTLQYREVQNRFEQAVQSDNQRFADPFVEVTHQYQAVAGELSPDFIAALDPRLQPNAWTLRAVSQWRAGEFTNALASATLGQAVLAQLGAGEERWKHSRDAVILTMVPGLVEDSRVRLRLESGGRDDVRASYRWYESRFQTALRAMAEARDLANPMTPPEVSQYWSYQAWRILNNWQIVLSNLSLAEASTSSSASEADQIVKNTVGSTSRLNAAGLEPAIANARKSVPEASPLAQLMALESQR